MAQTKNPESEFGEKQISQLLKHFSENTYCLPKDKSDPYLSDAIKLLGRDYILKEIQNEDGHFCPQYPERIPIIQSPNKKVVNTTIYETKSESQITSNKIINDDAPEKFIKGGNIARCRQRFPVPVIYFKGKYVCRSSTLSSRPEMCYRTGLNQLTGFEIYKCLQEFWWPSEGATADSEKEDGSKPKRTLLDHDSRVTQICNTVRSLDIHLLKYYNVSTIVDIMVEKRKVKASLYVSDSEKVDSFRYSDFQLVNLPYPGCEFFKVYYDNTCKAEELRFDWAHASNDAVLNISGDNIARSLNITWQNYKEWDLVNITKNYMKYLLKRLQDDPNGLLLHCISGWDRTPLFISLIRLSLWADGLIHTSLDENEILYFTLAYDWYLFGHHLHNRIRKNEEIMYFCFDFLQYIEGEEYSSKPTPSSFGSSSSSSASNLENSSSDPAATCRRDSSDDDKPPNIFRSDTPSPDHFAGHTLPGEPTEMDSCDDVPQARTKSPSSSQKNTSPIAGSSGTSAGATSVDGWILVDGPEPEPTRAPSTDGFAMVSKSGIIETDMSNKSQRAQKLFKVRDTFASCYQKIVQNENLGPSTTPSPLVYLYSYYDFLKDVVVRWAYLGNGDINEMETNGNVCDGDTNEMKANGMEINGKETNGKETNGNDVSNPENGN